MSEEMYSPGLENKKANVLGGIIGATVGAILGIAIWTLFAVLTERNIGYIAIAVGFIVGIIAKKVSKEPNLIVTVYACVVSLIAIFAGNAMTLVVFAAQFEEVGVLEILPYIDFAVLLEIIFTEIDYLDLLFMGIATYTTFNITKKPTQDMSSIPDLPPMSENV